MAWAIKRDGGLEELTGASFRAMAMVNGELDELRFPGNWPDLATDDERAALGIVQIAEPEAPAANERVTGSTIDADGKRILTIEPINAAEQMADVRARRNALLARSDWTQLPDVPLADGARAKWATYRQALRDVPAQGDPFDIKWPVRS